MIRSRTKTRKSSSTGVGSKATARLLQGTGSHSCYLRKDQATATVHNHIMYSLCMPSNAACLCFTPHPDLGDEFQLDFSSLEITFGVGGPYWYRGSEGGDCGGEGRETFVGEPVKEGVSVGDCLGVPFPEDDDDDEAKFIILRK